ncbi:hypothetical protein DXG03_001517, partial [Asterophora parasitica]
IMPLMTVLGLFKGAVRTPQYAQPKILPGRLNTKSMTHVFRQQPSLSNWTKLWCPPPVYAAPGPVLRELRTTTTFTTPYLFHLPNVYYSPLWRQLVTSVTRTSVASFWSLPKIDFYSTMRQYIGTLDEVEQLGVPADISVSIAEGSSLLPQSSILSATPGGDLISSEADNSPTGQSLQASTSQTGVVTPNRENSAVEVHQSTENFSLPPPSLSQTQVPPAFTLNEGGSSLSSGWVVPNAWKRKINLTITKSIAPKMFLAILKECPNLRALSVNICPPISSQEEIYSPEITRAGKLQMLSIMTSTDPHPVFTSLRLPKLKSLSLGWDRSSGHDLLACPEGLKIDKLLEKSSDFYSLSLSNIFPPEEELLAILKSHGEKLEELIVRADPTPGLLAMSLERLVTGKTLLALAHSGRLKSLDLSYASPEVVPAAEVSGLSATISSRELSAPAPWQLAISFAKIMDQEEIDREAEKLL